MLTNVIDGQYQDAIGATFAHLQELRQSYDHNNPDFTGCQVDQTC